MLTAARPNSAWHPKRLARSAALVGGAVTVAAAAFGLVLHFQPAITGTAATPRPDAVVSSSVGPDQKMPMGFGPGERPSLDNFENGQLTSRFRADAYDPQPDGTVLLARPVATFFLGRGEVMVVTGDTGDVTFGPGANGGGGKGMPTAMRPPTGGHLHHVHIDRFPTADVHGRPTLRMDTDNVTFDNDTLRLYTDKTADDAGHPVPGELVPVVIHGDDYDMDGTGLTLRWNGRDRRLHLLEIAHGHRLTIRHPNALRSPGTTQPTTVPAPPPPPVAAAPTGARPATPPAATTKTPAPTPPAPPAPPYRAVFNEAVEIKQLDEVVGTGDTLTIDFLQGHATAATMTPTAPRPPPTAPTVPTAPTPSTAPASNAPTSAPAATQPAGRAKVGTEPITISWHGKLRVTPLDAVSPMVELTPGQSAVRLAGRPATLAYGGATAAAAVATYRTGDGAVWLAPSAADPVVHLAQAKGATLDCRAVVFDPVTSVATLAGPAHLEVPQRDGHTMKVNWADRGLLHVAPTLPAGTDLGGIDHVDLTGDVAADDPGRFHLDAGRLLLDLDLLPPSTTRPAATAPGDAPGGGRERLRQLTAVGDVRCQMLRPGQPDRGLSADRLVVAMAPGPDGNPAPHAVAAHGSVYLVDDQQSLRADHLDAVLAPAPRPSTRPTTRAATSAPTTEPADAVALQSMVATGNVVAALKNGSTVDADVLTEATAADGRQLVELSGPRPVSVVTPKGDRLVGSVVHVSDQGAVTIDGPGSLHSAGKPTTRPAGTVPGRVMDVTWTDGLSFDTVANAADLIGHVIARTVDANGTVDTATGATCHVEFADAQPVPTKPGVKPLPKPATRPSGNADALGSKQVRSLTLAGHMHATSVLTVGEIVVRHGDLTGDRLVYAPDGTARVPGPGTLYVLNRPAPATAANPPAAAPSGGKQGEMALTWRTGLRYDQAADRVTVTGDATAGFLPDRPPARGGPPQRPMRLRADTIDIDLQKPTEAKKAKGDGAQIKLVRATGAVRFQAQAMTITCHAAELDPATGLLTARGTDAEPGRAVDPATGRAAAGGDGTFDVVVFDTNKQEIVDGTGVGGTFRK